MIWNMLFITTNATKEEKKNNIRLITSKDL